ncbi:MAG: hypothetical protein P8Z00_22710 [Anaerolineales bacterium]|jgi:hypothetical protein
MITSRVWIQYHPKLYLELFTRVLKSLEPVEVVGYSPSLSRHRLSEGIDPSQIDVILIPLNDQGYPELETLPGSFLETKVIAFSPKGDRGLRRLPGRTDWEEVQPFGLVHLVREVLSSSKSSNYFTG